MDNTVACMQKSSKKCSLTWHTKLVQCTSHQSKWALQVDTGGYLPDGTGPGGESVAVAEENDALLIVSAAMAAMPLSPAGPSSPESLFGAARFMTQTSGDPFILGPVHSDYVFPLPDTQEAAIRMAWTASYRAWLDRIRLQTVEWLLPESLQMADDMRFDAVVVALELMLVSLTSNLGLQGTLEARRLPGPGLAGGLSYIFDSALFRCCPVHALFSNLFLYQINIWGWQF